VRTAIGLARPPAQAKTAIQQQIDVTGRHACTRAGRIDRLVYELHDLTADEIRIVEEATRWG
jgi:hypothetical protein